MRSSVYNFTISTMYNDVIEKSIIAGIIPVTTGVRIVLVAVNVYVLEKVTSFSHSKTCFQSVPKIIINEVAH